MSAELNWSSQCAWVSNRQQGWIPVSERLPEYDEIVLLKIKDGEDYWYDNIVTGKRRKTDKFVQQREEYITTGMVVHEPDDVIAWMPIPEYRNEVE